MPSFDRPRQAETDISPWLRRFAHLLKPGGEVLDLAAVYPFLGEEFAVPYMEVEG